MKKDLHIVFALSLAVVFVHLLGSSYSADPLAFKGENTRLDQSASIFGVSKSVLTIESGKLATLVRDTNETVLMLYADFQAEPTIDKAIMVRDYIYALPQPWTDEEVAIKYEMLDYIEAYNAGTVGGAADGRDDDPTLLVMHAELMAKTDPTLADANAVLNYIDYVKDTYGELTDNEKLIKDEVRDLVDLLEANATTSSGDSSVDPDPATDTTTTVTDTTSTTVNTADTTGEYVPYETDDGKVLTREELTQYTVNLYKRFQNYHEYNDAVKLSHILDNYKEIIVNQEYVEDELDDYFKQYEEQVALATPVSSPPEYVDETEPEAAPLPEPVPIITNDSDLPFEERPYSGLMEIRWKPVYAASSEFVESVEFYYRKMYTESSQRMYMGMGKKAHDADGEIAWILNWDTTQVPNGKYVIIPAVEHAEVAEFEDGRRVVTVQNEIVTKEVAPVDTEKIEEVKEVVESVNEETKEVVALEKEKLVVATQEYTSAVDKYIANQKLYQDAGQVVKDESERIQNVVEHTDDIQRTAKTAEGSFTIIDAAVKEAGVYLESVELKQARRQFEEQILEVQKVAAENRKILLERVDERVFNDTDKDGISDYDEVNIYKTNPSLADSDGDGFVDGAEIVGGYDPLSDKEEAVIEYEQAKVAGLEEPEVFVVENIEVVEKKATLEGKEEVAKYRITGKAPANSYVTVYIYSTPVIVTVKTDENGDWVYELDKELEDGSHEIYVAITDNAGDIFAKSRALPFVKEAAAVSVGEEFTLLTTEAQPSFFDRQYMSLIILLLIIVIGWSLIFMGSRRSQVAEAEEIV